MSSGGLLDTVRPCGWFVVAPTVVTSVLRRPPALGSAPPTVQSSPRVGTVVEDQLVHGTPHRCGTDRLERGSQPEPDRPRPARFAW
jgi:hypothetical protein